VIARDLLEIATTRRVYILSPSYARRHTKTCLACALERAFRAGAGKALGTQGEQLEAFTTSDIFTT